MRVAIITDAWSPQVNGVVRTLEATRAALTDTGHEVLIVSPDRFASIPCPSYPEIRLALAGSGAVGRHIQDFDADAIHIATEGPLGHAARRWCLARRLPFTTAYHTQFPDYLAARTHLSSALFWPFVRRFHAPAEAILVSTPTIAASLHLQGLRHTRHWSRGVDLALFHSGVRPDPMLSTLPRPLMLYVGRIAVEKNVEAFLTARHPGTRVVVGDGPARAALQARHPGVIFTGARSGAALAAAYASADVLVFPSRTDTFGLVMIEAMACGTPVAAFPVAGPRDVLTGRTGVMDDDLDRAIEAALRLDRAVVARAGAGFSWPAATRQFLDALQPINMRVAA